MTIKVGDAIPSMKLMKATSEGPKETSTDEIFKGKKVVLFAVPGAFTPTCTKNHLPGYIANAAAIKAKVSEPLATPTLPAMKAHSSILPSSPMSITPARSLRQPAMAPKMSGVDTRSVEASMVAISVSSTGDLHR